MATEKLHPDILIIGAGAAGLMAMKELVQAGYSVCLLEAAATAGGRIATLAQQGFDGPVETGAEFIHGDLPLTIELLKQAAIFYQPLEGKQVLVQNGVWFGGEEWGGSHFDILTEKLNQLKKDCTILQFLDEHFPLQEYEELRKSVQQFSEGFELADISKASVFALRKEWADIEDNQYRIPGGYSQLIDYLFENCNKYGSAIHFSSPVYKIEHSEGHVIAYTTDNKQYEASKIIITVSAGVLQSGDISFVPALTHHASAIQQLGFGSVIKVLFQFKEPFWLKNQDDIGFLLTDEAIPTWWTQLPRDTSLLTGWLGGARAAKAAELFGNELYELSLSSLSNIFKLDISILRNQLNHHRIICWDTNPYVKGGYSYTTLHSENAIKIVEEPLYNTLYFAGEAIYTGESQGTVEAALASGKQVADRIRQ
jgi:monoamine oxidase